MNDDGKRRQEALHWFQEIDRLEREMSRGERRRPGEAERAWRKRRKARRERLSREIGRAAEMYSRVCQYGPARKYPCPCCELQTLDEQPPGTYQICPVCWWEDDSVQFRDPEYRGGANRESLNEARAAFRRTD